MEGERPVVVLLKPPLPKHTQIVMYSHDHDITSRILQFLKTLFNYFGSQNLGRSTMQIRTSKERDFHKFNSVAERLDFITGSRLYDRGI